MPRIQDVSFILDSSFSMQVRQQQVVDGYNEFIQAQQQTMAESRPFTADSDVNALPPLEIRFTLATFNTQVRLVHDGVPVASVPPLLLYGQPTLDRTVDYYRPDGNTALHDALGVTLAAIEHRAREIGEKATVLVVLMTDGKENSSQRFTKLELQEKIARLSARENWTFVYLGADQDAWAEALPLGFSYQNSGRYDSRETLTTMREVTAATTGYLKSGRKKSHDFFGKGTSPVIPVEKK